MDAPKPKYTPEFQAVVDKAFEIYNRKGDDYTIGQAQIDRLANFRATAELLGITMFQTFAVHWYKHVSAVLAYAKTGKVESEGIEGRLLDLINYAILAHQIVQETSKPNSKQLELPLEAVLEGANQACKERKKYEGAFRRVFEQECEPQPAGRSEFGACGHDDR